MYDYSAYEAELRGSAMEIRLTRSREEPEDLKVLVTGKDVNEVTRIAEAIRVILRGGREKIATTKEKPNGKVVRPKR